MSLYSDILDAATTTVNRRRRHNVQRYLEDHVTLLGALQVTRWLWRKRHAPGHGIGAALGAGSAVYDTLAAAAAGRRARNTNNHKQVPVYCGACGRMIPPDRVASHLAWHEANNRRTNTSGPALVNRNTNSRHEGKRRNSMAILGTPETAALIKAARRIGAMHPKTAWDVIAQLNGLSRGMSELTEATSQYTDAVDSERVDPRVVIQLADAMDSIAVAALAFAKTSAVFRALYAPLIEAAEAGTNARQPKNPHFFNPDHADI